MARTTYVPKGKKNIQFRALPVVLAMASMPIVASASPPPQTEVEPGFNLFSKDQEVEIGQESAREVEQELPVLRDQTVGDYVDRVGSRLAREAPGADYPYQFKVLDLAEANAFALPGGFIYVNRGLIEQVRNEGELAGVLAHEISHVALRHGTNQVSKAYLAQAGISALGGLLGAESTTGDIVEAVGGVGLPLLFLKFSRSAEEQADTMAAQIMARAGYAPSHLAEFFEAGGGRGGPPEFLSSHPSYENRQENIRREAELLAPIRETGNVGGLDRVQAELDRMDPAPTMEQVSEGRAPDTSPRRSERGTADVRVERPSSRFVSFTQADGYYRLSHPANWRVYEAEDGFGVTIVPEGGLVGTSTGRNEIVYGFIVNHYQPFDNEARRGRGSLGALGFRSSSPVDPVPDSLERATRDIILQVMDINPHLQPVRDSAEHRVVDGEPGLRVELTGTSPVTNQEERVGVLTRNAGDGHVLYVLTIAPGPDAAELESTFERMISSLEVDDSAVHVES